ncbi:MAG: indole-3-glycerol-phosphate synthase [Halodesulfurarchaeum sp.]
MNETAGLAPPVEAILESARARGGGDGAIDVDGTSLSSAIEETRRSGRNPVIAEVKPTSPTTETTRTDDPATLARRMVEGGATAISVLTEPEHFGGSIESLRAVREAVSVPVLRKDFLLREEHLDLVAADAVLLIARFLDDNAGRDHAGMDLEAMVEAARARGMEPLVEVHTRDELDRAVAAGADLLGINNRDLAALEVDLRTFERVAPHAPGEATLVAESGIETPGAARRMLEAGADALLVGSAIMDGDVAVNTEELVDA